MIEQDDLEHIWQKLQPYLEEISQAEVFLTGGTGFFGSWLLESFCYARKKFNLNTKWLVLSRNPEVFKKKFPHLLESSAIQFLDGDIRSFSFPDRHFTHIIHGATEASEQLNREEPSLMLETIIEGTRRALDFAVFSQAKKFLFISSGAIYGQQPESIMNIAESDSKLCNPLALGSAYGIGKYTAENLAILYGNQHEIAVKIARCFAFVGPYLPLTTHFAIGNFIDSAIKDTSLEIKGDGSAFRSYLYAADLVIWLWTILCKGRKNVAYNVGSENSINIEDLAKLIAYPRNLSVMLAKKKEEAVKPLRYVPSTQLAQAELGLCQWIDLPVAIEKTLRWNENYAKKDK